MLTITTKAAKRISRAVSFAEAAFLEGLLLILDPGNVWCRLFKKHSFSSPLGSQLCIDEFFMTESKEKVHCDKMR